MAHHLKPVVTIGKVGIIDGAIDSIDRALDDHELIKIKLSEIKKLKLRDNLLDILENDLSAFVVGNVGHTFIIFRPQNDKNKRRINI